MQILGVDQTLNIVSLVLLKLACLKTTRLEPWLVQYAVQLYDIGKEVKTSHLNQIHVAAGYGGVGGFVMMLTCKAVQFKIASDYLRSAINICYWCALWEQLLDRIIKLRASFNCAKLLKFALSTVVKQPPRHAWSPANVASQVESPWLNL